MALNQLVSGLLHARWFVVLTAIATSVLRKAVSIGIFIGIALPTIEWIYLWSV